jgi:membrane protein required for colicin V production
VLELEKFNHPSANDQQKEEPEKEGLPSIRAAGIHEQSSRGFSRNWVRELALTDKGGSGRSARMNLLDVIIIATTGFFVLRGLFRGFFREIGSLAGVILGIWFAVVFSPQAGAYLVSFFPSLGVATVQLIVFCGIFLVMLLICNLAGFFLKMLARKSSLGWADRSLGAGLAVLKGVILAYLAIILLTFFVPAGSSLIGNSSLAPVVITSYQSLVGLISPATYLHWKNRFLGQGKPVGKLASEKGQGPAAQDGF